MQRQKSNIGNFVFKHSEKSTPDEASLKKNLTCESTESVNHPSSEKYSAKAEKHLDTGVGMFVSEFPRICFELLMQRRRYYTGCYEHFFEQIGEKILG